MPGDDRLARLPLVLHVMRLTLHAERGRHLDEVHDLAVVMVGRTVDIGLADVDHDHGVETGQPLLAADVQETGRADRSLVDEAHPVVAAHVADVVLAGPHDGVLRLAAGGGGDPGALNRLTATSRASRAPGNEALGDAGDVVDVVDRLDPALRALQGVGDGTGPGAPLEAP